MRVCQIVPSLEEHHGGPSKSVLALAQALARAGAAVDLLAAHATERQVRDFERLRIRIHPRTWPRRLCCSAGLRAELAAQRYDIVHSHALWLRPLHYAHQHADATGAPFVISPRGMMSPWAWGFHRGRKLFARRFVHPGAFEAAAGWHATSQEEAEAIQALGFRQPICVAPNGVEPPEPAEHAAARAAWHRWCPESAERPTALFYSRFHCKKRVLELIDLWLERAPRDWLLLMVGVPEEYTPAQLETYVLRAGGGGQVRVHDGVGRPAPYPVASLFLLPSHSENFGLVIAEAMASGVPVLVTDTTPWTEVNSRGVGWCVPWQSYGEVLSAALRESPTALAARGAAARTWVTEQFSWASSARKLAAFYRELLAERARPPTPDGTG